MTGDERIEELQESGSAVGELARNPELFKQAAAAFLADDAERFQDVLGRANLLPRCRWICRWFCSKHCVFVCVKLAGPLEAQHEADIEEWRQFAEFTGRLAEDPDALAELLKMVEGEDAKAFQAYVGRHKIQGFAHQLCHWLCRVRCRVACTRLCPPLPELIKVGYIPVGQIDATGLAAGDSSPSGFTPPDNPAAGAGDHPFGGRTHINGRFNIVGAIEYKVEVGPSAAGPWTAVTTPLKDSHNFGFTKYPRVATGDWYRIADMDTLSEGQTYLTDWDTPAAERDVLHYVRMVVRNSALTEFASVPVPVRVDNGRPSGPVAPGDLPLIEFSQGGRPLECCSKVTKDNGPVDIHIEGIDEHFSVLDVIAYGGCSASILIYSHTYNGDRTDVGAPAPGVTVTWDPWATNVDPCCYVVFVRMWDRAIVTNQFSNRHVVENWRSITVA